MSEIKNSEIENLKKGISELQALYLMNDGYIVYLCDSAGTERVYSFINRSSAEEVIDECLVHWRCYYSIKLLKIDQAKVTSILWRCDSI